MKPKSQKEIAQRIDPGYHARSHPLRAWKSRLSWGAALAAFLWGGWLVSAGGRSAFAAGPVSSRHALFENDCAKCHADAFAAVRDSSCTACHAASPHAPEEKAAAPACASCHGEHRGREHLDRVPDARCNGCHAHHRSIEDLSGHAPFEVPAHDQQFRFPHTTHARPDLKGGPLSCSDCHALSRRGDRFRPIGYEAHCSRCHPLGFDVDRPDARAPHGLPPGETRLRVQAFYLGALREGLGEGETPLPGREPPPPPTWERELLARADGAMRVLDKACLQCHVEGIPPPRIPNDWMPRADFSHETHRLESCAKCHAMQGNDRAETLSLPGVETCRECHKPSGARTTCVACHPYHR